MGKQEEGQFSSGRHREDRQTDRETCSETGSGSTETAGGGTGSTPASGERRGYDRVGSYVRVPDAVLKFLIRPETLSRAHLRRCKAAPGLGGRT